LAFSDNQLAALPSEYIGFDEVALLSGICVSSKAIKEANQ